MKPPHTRNRFSLRLVLISAALLVALVSTLGVLLRPRLPRARTVAETPVAFWAWQNDSPNQRDVQAAVEGAGAKSLFVRAGQIDYQNGELRRIRDVKGRLPSAVELHLVYNATRSLLLSFAEINAEKLAVAISETVQRDVARAANDGARVVGVQLDFDAPTRQLPKYADLLRILRQYLPSGTSLSITGLPTWMDSADLKGVLQMVDFWIPQCYGAMIPQRLDVIAPITSSSYVAETIARANELNCLFYAGLSAYGYAIHYTREGELLALRGDLNPELLVGDAHLELIERRAFHAPDVNREDEEIAGNWRYVFRARRGVVIDGLVIRAGEFVMLELPSAALLRACAETARDMAGERFLGLCVFRLPTPGDATSLTIQEISGAIQNKPLTPETDIEAHSEVRVEGDASYRYLILRIANDGAVASTIGEDVFVVEVRLPEESLHSVSCSPTLQYESQFVAPSERAFDRGRPCGERRANLLRFKSPWWKPNSRAEAVIKLRDVEFDALDIRISMRTADGKTWREERRLRLSQR